MSQPKLRFPGFTDEWQGKKLGEIARLERGRFSPRPRNNPRYYGGEIPFVQTGDVVKSSGVISQYSQTLNEDGLKVSKLFPKDTILITIAANIGHTGILARDMACPDSLIGICCNESMSPVFLNYYLSTQQKRMDNIATEAAQKNINIEFLKPYPIQTTSMDEQRKVAGFLTVVDEKIANLEQKAEKLEAYKRSVMQKIFTQKIRFLDSESNKYPVWQTKPFGTVVLINPKADHLPSKFVYIDLESVNNGRLLHKRSLLKSEAPSRAQRLLQEGDILFQTVRPYQRNNYLFSSDDGNYVASTGYAQIRASIPRFFYHLMHTDTFVNSVLEYCTGTNYPAVNSSDLAKVVVRVPSSTEEQEQIADFLSAVDEKIELTRATLEKTKEFKKSLLQRMFV